ncbi:hypothetical protein MIB92_13890 [Aestuariirhabdus sp. Z084]|uniref:hypothetical protein n=1 Tax=Aestuariirhabdus haliotis TaxID=2918751 RepID=UPI00201B415F|nr:hypothetical protein [Aestuariirhabdus haliotis]MCL6416747.1 hypothetical protein [Aestuariirhabdus haliotis]MCL6420747.1 hypothetical protein [Aestuariirhabdus haliotis]
MDSVPQNKKLTLLFRVEPGCLGPEGESHIDEFCVVAQQEFEQISPDFIRFSIVPRRDKSLPENEYRIADKSLSHDQASRYLAHFQENLEELEDQLNELLSHLIDRYLGH